MSDWWERDGVQVLVAGVLLIGLFQYSDEIKNAIQRALNPRPVAANSPELVPEVQEIPVQSILPQMESRHVIFVMPAKQESCRPLPRCH